jgi:choline dehydrogenase-like flavoprotein
MVARLAGVAAPLLATVVGAPSESWSHFRRGFADLCAEAPPRLVLGNLAGLGLLRVAPLFLSARFGPLAVLSSQDRQACLGRLAASRWYVIRALFFTVKATALLLLSRRPKWSSRSHVPHAAAVKDQRYADYVVVGSGAAGATVALDLARAGRDVLVLEEGPWLTTQEFPADLYSALRDLWREFGTQLATGRSVIPVLQGRCVGGSTVINGAIIHRLSRSVWESWGQRDPKLVDALPWDDFEAAAASLERDLQVVAKLASHLGQLPMHQTLERLGWQHSAMVRNAPGCMHTGQCLLGCPTGGKWSMDRSFIPTARELGARIQPNVRIARVLFEGRRAIGVEAAGGETILARRAVVITAGVVHTPLLLRSSGIRHADLGMHFQCHLSSAVVGRYAEVTAAIEGPAMGLEVLHFPDVKLATQCVPPEMLALRLPVHGDSLRQLLAHADHLGAWTATVRSEAEGTVSGSLARPRIRFSPLPGDMSRLRFGAARIVELLLAAGAEAVYPQIVGLPEILKGKEGAGLVEEGPTDPRRYALATSHLFGTCRIGTDPSRSVVGPDFQVRGRESLYVADASLFPTATGVNPQHAIMALARMAAQRLIQA